MNIQFRKTTQDDLDEVMTLFDIARGTMATLGIDQWQDGYPQRERIADDIEKGISYVVLLDGIITATTVLLLEDEPDYAYIENGEWLTEGNYLTVHRITVHPRARGTGLIGRMFDHAAEKAAENGLTSVRVDTHEGNIPMRKALAKNGFTHCGTIYLTVNGDPRVAYEKVLR